MLGHLPKPRSTGQDLIASRQAVQYRPAVVPVGSKSLAESMLANYDEAQIHSRLAAEREREDMIELDGAPDDLGTLLFFAAYRLS